MSVKITVSEDQTREEDPVPREPLQPIVTAVASSSKLKVQRKELPEGLALTLWIDTPLGFIYHQLSAKDTKKLMGKMHPASWRDLFWHAQKLWPGLEGLDTDKLTYGNICQKEENGTWVVWYSDDAVWPFPKSRKEDLRRFFCLPPKTPVRCSC